jgi:hypothetical protein
MCSATGGSACCNILDLRTFECGERLWDLPRRLWNISPLLSGEMTGFDGVGKGKYIFGYGALLVSLTWARQGKREMATEQEGSAPEQPRTEPKEPHKDRVARMILDLEKRMATLSDAVVEQSTERAQLSRVFLSWSEFAATAGAAGSRRNPEIERYLSLWVAGRGEASSGESTLVQGDVSVTPSLDEINALLERLDHDVAAERVALDDLLKRILAPRDSSPGRWES